MAQLPLQSIRQKKGYHWFVVATVCVGAFMAALDASIINIALPVMKHDFHTHMHVIEWVSLAYILTLAALLVPFSRLSDMFGRRWMYTIGFSVFIVGSFLCGMTDSLGLLFTSRVLQAVGAAMLQANSVSIITAATPSFDRGKAIGIQASAQGIGLSLGPIIGGALMTLLSWRWIFYVNVPVGIIGTLLGILILPEDIRKKVREKFDLLGAIALAPTLVAVIFVLNTGLQKGWASPMVLVSYVVILVGMATFYFTEKKVAFPMVDFSLFKIRTFSFGNTTVMLSFTVMYAVMFLAPFYLDNVQSESALTSGLYLTAIPVGMTIFTPISGAIADKLGPRIPLLAGMAIATIGSLLLAFTCLYYSVAGFIIGLFLVGVGMGVFTPPNNSQVMGCVNTNRLGITGGMLNMARTLGMGLGVTLGGLAYQLFLKMHGANSENSATAFQMKPSFNEAFLFVTVVSALVIFFTLLSNEKKQTVISQHTGSNEIL